MPQQISLPLEQQDIQAVTDIVKKITTRKDDRKKSRWESGTECAFKIVFRLMICGAALCFLLAVIIHFWGSKELLTPLKVILITTMLLDLVVLIFPAITYLPLMVKISREPATPILQLVERATTIDLPLVQDLMRCKSEAIKFVLTHYKHQHQAYENRRAILAGPLEKVGFFPAMLTFAVLVVQYWNRLPLWIQDLSTLVPIFYTLYLLTYSSVQNMGRTIALLEFSATELDKANDATVPVSETLIS